MPETEGTRRRFYRLNLPCGTAYRMMTPNEAQRHRETHGPAHVEDLSSEGQDSLRLEVIRCLTAIRRLGAMRHAAAIGRLARGPGWKKRAYKWERRKGSRSDSPPATQDALGAGRDAVVEPTRRENEDS
jgi:hypothetical protein